MPKWLQGRPAAARTAACWLAVLLLLLALGTAAQAQPQVTVTRDLPGSFTPGGEITVTLTMDVNEASAPRSVIINELGLQGWTVVSATPTQAKPQPPATEIVDVLSWLFITGLGNPVQDTVIEYTVRVPEGVSGLFTFAGEVKFNDPQGNPVTLAVQGDTEISSPLPPAVPTLISPDDGAVVSPTPTFQATSTDPNGDQFRIIVEATQNGTTETFESGLVDSGATASITVPAGRALASGNWNWRARAEDAGGAQSAFSDPRSFKVNQPPATPQQLSPADGAVVTTTPALRAQATDPDGDQVVLVFELRQGQEVRTREAAAVASGTPARLQIPGSEPLTPGVWTWRVRARDDDGAESDFSGTRTIDVDRPPGVPEQIAPAAGTEVTERPTVFRVRAVDPDNDQVRFVIEANPGSSGRQGAEGRVFEIGLVNSGEEAAFSVPPEQRLENGPWNWRAKAIDAKGMESAFSAFIGFTVNVPNDPPSTPTLIAPPDGELVSRTPTLQMSATDPNGDQVRFQVELTHNSATVNLESDLVASGATASVTVPSAQALAPGVWNWRARAMDDKGDVSGFSDSRTIRVNEPPATPQLVHPPNNALISPTPELTARATDPENGQVKIIFELTQGATVKTVESGLVDSGSDASALVPVAQALSAGGGTWRARAEDSFGDRSAFSGPRNFTVPDSLPRIARGGGLSTLGFPFQIDPVTPAALGLGPARIAEWVPTDEAYRLDALVEQITTGEGVWVRSDAAVPVRFVGAPLAGNQVTPLQVGWNLISPAFLQPVAWSLTGIQVRRNAQTLSLRAARDAGWIEDISWGWQPNAANPDTGQYRFIYDASVLGDVLGELRPWEAYWVNALVACDLILSGGGATRKADVTPRSWTLQVTAEGAAGAAQAVLGITEGRSLSAGAPPLAPTAGDLRLALVREGRPLAVDVRRSKALKQTWTLAVERVAPTAGEVVLSWPTAGRLPRELSLTLVDQTTGARRSLRTTPHYVYQPAPDEISRQFEIIVQEGRDRPLQVSSLRATPGRGAALRIQFGLSRAAHTTVVVRGLHGGLVGEIERAQSRAQGDNVLPWDGRDTEGRRLAPGVYLLELQAVDADGRQVRAVATVRLP